MTVCGIWDVRSRLGHPRDYAENTEKTANPNYTQADRSGRTYPLSDEQKEEVIKGWKMV